MEPTSAPPASPSIQDPISGLAESGWVAKGFYGAFLALSIEECHSAIRYKYSVDSLPDSPHKAERVWQAKKKLVASGGSLFSSLAIGANWLENRGLFSVGVASPIMGIVGYGGWVISSLFRLPAVISQIQENFQLYRGATSQQEEMLRLGKTIERMTLAAYHVAVIGMGVLGIASSCVVSAAISALLQSSLMIVGVIALIELFLILSLPTPPKKAVNGA